MTSDEEEYALTPALLAGLWKDLKNDRASEDEALASFQKFMLLHEDMHPIWDQLVDDPATSLDRDGENLLLHIAMDVACEKSLQKNEPAGIQAVFAALVQGGFETAHAFHVVQQAMMHEFMTAASQNQEMSPEGFLGRAREYGKLAIEQGPPQVP